MRSTYKQLYYINRSKVKDHINYVPYYNRRKGCCIIDRVVLPAGRVEQQERRSQKQQAEWNAG